MLDGPIVHDLELSRNLNPIAIWILNEDEEIVAWAMTPRPPHQFDVLLR